MSKAYPWPFGESELADQRAMWNAAGGVPSEALVGLFSARGDRFSVHTLRKYVQLGMLPRSTRVGEPGMHRGSYGLYPAEIISRLAMVRSLLRAGWDLQSIAMVMSRPSLVADAVAGRRAQASARWQGRLQAYRSVLNRSGRP